MAAGAPTGFGELLHRHRRAAGLSREALAERTGLSARGIGDLERGTRPPPLRDTIDLLASALRLAPDERAGLEAAARRRPSSSPPPESASSPPRPELPVGTVAFLLTDVEGSTRLWDEEPDAMRS